MYVFYVVYDRGNIVLYLFFFSSRRRHTRSYVDWSSDVCSSDLAERLSSCADASFDGVTCQLGLMDIGDLAAAVHAVARVLRPAGWFVLVIGHPCFLAPGASTAEGPGGVPGRLITGY